MERLKNTKVAAGVTRLSLVESLDREVKAQNRNDKMVGDMLTALAKLTVDVMCGNEEHIANLRVASRMMAEAAKAYERIGDRSGQNTADEIAMSVEFDAIYRHTRRAPLGRSLRVNESSDDREIAKIRISELLAAISGIPRVLRVG